MDNIAIRNTLATLTLSTLIDEYKENGIKSDVKCCIFFDTGNTELGNIAKVCPDDSFATIVNTQNTTNNDKNIFALLHTTSFSFICIEIKTTLARYLDSIGHSISHKGYVAITTKDVSTLYNKCPERTSRLYNGKLYKCDFSVELATRLLLANIAQAFARWDKGILPITCFGNSDGILIIVKVLKGSEHADRSISLIQKLAYCSKCTSRCFMPDTLYAPSKTAIDILQCECQENNPETQPPVLILGPIWSGIIFDFDYMLTFCNYFYTLKLPNATKEVLRGLVLESACLKSTDSEINLCTKIKKCFLNEEKFEMKNKIFFNNLNDSNALHFNPESYIQTGLNPPKLFHVINELRRQNFSASRTHFYSKGIRTSAEIREIKQLLSKISIKTQKCTINENG